MLNDTVAICKSYYVSLDVQMGRTDLTLVKLMTA